MSLLRRHQQLEEELAIVIVKPVREASQPLGLPPVHLRVAVGVVANEHLREVGVVALDVGAEVIAVLEVEFLLTTLLHRHREPDAAGLDLLGNLCGASELLVDQTAGHGWIGAATQRDLEPLEDQVLAVGDPLGLLGRRLPFDPEPLRERAAVVEREDVELAVVA